MEYIFIALIVFILLNTLLKLSFQQWWEAIIYSLLLVGFLCLTWEFASTQSKTEWMTWLYSSEILQNVSVLITLEALVIFGFAFVRLQNFLGVELKLWIRKPLYYYPPLLAFPALFYLLTQLFFTLTGVSFAQTTYWMIGAVIILIPLIVLGLKHLLPEEDLRLEILFITNLFVCLVGLVATASAETIYAPQRDNTVDWSTVTIAILSFVVLFGGGYLINKYRKRKNNTL